MPKPRLSATNYTTNQRRSPQAAPLPQQHRAKIASLARLLSKEANESGPRCQAAGRGNLGGCVAWVLATPVCSGWDLRNRHVPEVNSADGSHLLSPASCRLHEKIFESGTLNKSRSPRKRLFRAIGARYSGLPCSSQPFRARRSAMITPSAIRVRQNPYG